MRFVLVFIGNWIVCRWNVMIWNVCFCLVMILLSNCVLVSVWVNLFC